MVVCGTTGDDRGQKAGMTQLRSGPGRGSTLGGVAVSNWFPRKFLLVGFPDFLFQPTADSAVWASIASKGHMFFQGSELRFRKPSKTQINRRFFKRTMVEQNEPSTPRSTGELALMLEPGTMEPPSKLFAFAMLHFFSSTPLIFLNYGCVIFLTVDVF